MILDANLLLYAVDRTAAHHATAKEFLERQLNGDTRVGLPWQSLGAFVRIATHPRVMSTPMTAAEATSMVDDWLAAPTAWIPDITTATWAIARRMIVHHQVTGNLIPDVQLAALAIQHGVPVASADSDFARFPEVTWLNPLV